MTPFICLIQHFTGQSRSLAEFRLTLFQKLGILCHAENWIQKFTLFNEFICIKILACDGTDCRR